MGVFLLLLLSFFYFFSFLLLLLLILIPGGGAICAVDRMHHRVESSSCFPWMIVLLFLMMVTFSSSNMHRHPELHKFDINNTNDRSISTNTCAMCAFNMVSVEDTIIFLANDLMTLLLAHFTSSG